MEITNQLPNDLGNNLDKVLQDSKINLETQVLEKKGRGRPKKDASQPFKPGNNTSMSSGQYKTMLGSLIRFSGEFLATGTKFDGFRMTDGEVDLLATQASDVAVEFVPSIQSKYVKLGLFTASAISVYGIKYYTFIEMEKIRINNLPKAPPENQNV